MSKAQKVIKYLGVAFAFFLIFNIISGIMHGITFIGNIFTRNNNEITEKLDSLEINEDTLLLDIDVKTTSIVIKNGDNFIAETNSKYVNFKQDKNRLHITERNHNWFNNYDNNEVIVYVPSEFIFDMVSIETGAGKLKINELSTKELYLNLGAGKVEVNDLEVLDNAKIDGGAGEVTINHGNINNLDLDMGVGRLSLNSKLKGSSKIDSGIGRVDLYLLGSVDDYKIELDKGIGSVMIDGNTAMDNTIYGTGVNRLKVSGGIGSINIKFE